MTQTKRPTRRKSSKADPAAATATLARGRTPELPPAEVDRLFREGVALFNGARYWHAHEAWETAWKQARGTDEAEFFKGLSQMGAGYVHLLRGNAHGAITLMRRASSRVVHYPDGHRGIHTQALHDRLEADAAAVERGDLVPGPDVIFEPIDV